MKIINTSRFTLRKLALSAMFAVAATPATAATTYNAIFLDGLPDGVDNLAVDINASGLTVGRATTSGAVVGSEYDIDHAVLWNTGGQVMDLAPVGSNFSSGIARSINASSQVLLSLDASHYLWNNGVLTNLSAQGLTGTPTTMNDAGVIAGYRSGRAFIWNNGVTTDLALLQNFAGAVGVGEINNVNQVAGYAELPGIYAGITRAVVWHNGSIQDLGTLPTDTHSRAAAINDLGQVVGTSSYSYTSTGLLRDPSSRAFVWNNGVMTDLGSLDPNSINTSATDINNLGQIVGTTILPAKGSLPSRSAAFLWNNGTLTNLNTILGSDSCYASAINDAGQIIGNCNNRAFKLTPVAPGVDVGVSQVPASGIAAQGYAFTYTMTVTNSGSLSATGVTLTDVLPAGFNFVSAVTSQGSCAGTSTISCAIGNMASGASVSVALTVIPTATGTFTNSVSVAANEADANSVNNTASRSVVVKAAQDTTDVGINMVATPNPATALANLTYTITVTNSGVGTANSVSVIDSLPANVNFISASSSQGSCSGSAMVTCSFGSIASGASATATIVIQPRSNGTLSNTARVSSSTSDVNSANDYATTHVVVGTASASADVALSMTDRPDPVRKGADLIYTITARNNGPATATAVIVNDTLSPFVSYVSASSSTGGCTATPTTVKDSVGSTVTRNTTAVSCSVGDLANGATTTVTIVVRPQLTGTISNTASATAGSYDANTTNNVTTVSTRVR